MIFYKWHIENDSHIGISLCKDFRIEITCEGGRYRYVIRIKDGFHSSSDFRYTNTEEAKKIAVSITSLHWAIP